MVERHIRDLGESFMAGRQFTGPAYSSGQLGCTKDLGQPLDARGSSGCPRSLVHPNGKADNVVLLRPPGVGKSRLAIALGYKTIASGYTVQLDTYPGGSRDCRRRTQLTGSRPSCASFGATKLRILDEVGCIPFDSDAAIYSSTSWPTAASKDRSW